MVRFFRPTSAELESHWKEVRRLWRSDAIRRRHDAQLTELRHAAMLGECQLWIAWDDQPRDRPHWTGPHYCLGIVAAYPLINALSVQFACGRSLTKWLPQAVSRLEGEARHNNLWRIELYCRTGWKPTVAHCWNIPVIVHRDPERLRVYPDRAAVRASA